MYLCLRQGFSSLFKESVDLDPTLGVKNKITVNIECKNLTLKMCMGKAFAKDVYGKTLQNILPKMTVTIRVIN